MLFRSEVVYQNNRENIFKYEKEMVPKQITNRYNIQNSENFELNKIYPLVGKLLRKRRLKNSIRFAMKVKYSRSH